MSKETELLEEIQKLTRRLAELESERTANAGKTSTSAESNNPSVTVLHTNNATNAKPDNYSDGPWHEWISHFKPCAQINGWNEAQ